MAEPIVQHSLLARLTSVRVGLFANSLAVLDVAATLRLEGNPAN